jgi:hypothetical protein
LLPALGQRGGVRRAAQHRTQSRAWHALQIAKLLGAKVVAVDLGPHKMELLRAQGGPPAGP